MPQVERQRVVETATEARAGRPGRPVLFVLLGSVVGIIVLFAIVYLAFFVRT
jgi:hypothetical protein